MDSSLGITASMKIGCIIFHQATQRVTNLFSTVAWAVAWTEQKVFSPSFLWVVVVPSSTRRVKQLNLELIPFRSLFSFTTCTRNPVSYRPNRQPPPHFSLQPIHPSRHSTSFYSPLLARTLLRYFLQTATALNKPSQQNALV